MAKDLPKFASYYEVRPMAQIKEIHRGLKLRNLLRECWAHKTSDLILVKTTRKVIEIRQGTNVIKINPLALKKIIAKHSLNIRLASKKKEDEAAELTKPVKLWKPEQNKH